MFGSRVFGSSVRGSRARVASTRRRSTRCLTRRFAGINWYKISGAGGWKARGRMRRAPGLRPRGSSPRRPRRGCAPPSWPNRLCGRFVSGVSTRLSPDPREKIATCCFLVPSFAVARGSLICLGVGVERARAVDPWRGRDSVKGAELTYEGLARARVRCFVRRRVARLNPRRNPRSKNNNPAGVFPLLPSRVPAGGDQSLTCHELCLAFSPGV